MMLRYNRWFLITWLLFMIAGSFILLLLPSGYEVVWINQKHHLYWDYFFKYATEMGNGLIYVLVAAWLAWHRVGYGIIALICFSATGLTVQVLKRFVFADLDRPKLLLQHYGLHFVEGEKILTQYSFPSGHTATAFSMFYLLSLLVRDERLGLPFALFAVIAGFSRIYLAQHFLADVLAGSVVGVALTFVIYNVWIHRKYDKLPLMQKPAKDVF
jgi:membrane-associated phospholipid phosphatase